MNDVTGVKVKEIMSATGWTFRQSKTRLKKRQPNRRALERDQGALARDQVKYTLLN